MFLLIQQPVFALSVAWVAKFIRIIFGSLGPSTSAFIEEFFPQTGATAQKERSRINDNLLVMRALIKANLKLIENNLKKGIEKVNYLFHLIFIICMFFWINKLWIRLCVDMLRCNLQIRWLLYICPNANGLKLEV